MMKDNEEFEQLRGNSIDEIEYVNKKIKHSKGLKKIKKATFGNMIDQNQFDMPHLSEYSNQYDSHNEHYECNSQKSSMSQSHPN